MAKEVEDSEQETTLESVRQVKRSRRAGLKGNLTKLTNSLKKWTLDPDVTQDQLDSAYSRVEVIYHNLCEENFALTALYKEESTEATECTKYMDDVFGTYDEATTLYEKAKAKMAKNADSAKSESKHASSTAVRVKLAPLANPTWDLDIRKFADFKSTFCELIEKNTSPSSALFYLKEAIPLSARGILAGCTTIKEAWEALDERYGDEQLIAGLIIRDIREAVPIRDGQEAKLLEFIEGLQKARLDMRRIGLDSELSHSSTVNIIEEKLPKRVVERWRRLVIDEKIKLSELFPKLMEFLQTEARLIRIVSQSCNAVLQNTKSPISALNLHGQAKEGSDNPPDRKISHGAVGKPSAGCLFHDNTDSHMLKNCKAFSDQPLEARRKFILENRLCGICLDRGHFRMKCQAQPVCPIEKCNERHVRGAHGFMAAQVVRGSDSLASQGSTSFPGSGCCIRPVVEGFLRSTPDGDDGCMNHNRIAILMDGGASTSLIAESRAQKAGLSRAVEHLTMLEIEVVGGDTGTYLATQYIVPLYDRFYHKVLTVKAYGIPQISNRIKKVTMAEAEKVFDLDPDSVHRPSGSIELLLGVDNTHAHPVSRAELGTLRLDETAFGPVIWGYHESFQSLETEVEREVVSMCSVTVKDFFSTENMGVACVPRCGSCRCGQCAPGSGDLTLKEESEMRLIDSCVTLLPQEKMIVAEYPWIKDPKTLKDNFFVAQKRLESVERRLLRDSSLAEAYQQQVDDMLERGVLRKLAPSEIRDWSGAVRYLPHFGVENPNSSSTPLRIVMNASSPYQGQVLNDYWAKGCNVVKSLLATLMRFREEPVAIYGDIRKMYHTIHVGELEQHCQRFLWRDLQTDRAPDIYVVTRNCFGNGPAGVIAHVGLQKCARHMEALLPSAAQTILEQTYVDDILDCLPNHDLATQRTKDVDKILDVGGFKIKSWLIGSAIESANTSRPEVDLAEERVLGVIWDPQRDIYRYKVSLNFDPTRNKARRQPEVTLEDFNERFPPTLNRRLILRQVNGLFDPCGFGQPYVIKLKCSLGQLFKSDTGKVVFGWDDEIPPNQYLNWRELLREMFQMEELSVPRCIRPARASGEPWLLTFTDSSIIAFGACCYARWKTEEGFRCILLVAKAKPWPIDPGDRITIVRGELQGAVLGKRIAEFVVKHHRIRFERKIFLTDSAIVRAMIEKDSHGFQTFVANRVGEIRSFTDPSEWYHIPGECNIADWLTRGRAPRELGPQSSWQAGPPFASRPWSEWPVSQRQTNEPLPETRKQWTGAGQVPSQNPAENVTEEAIIHMVTTRAAARAETTTPSSEVSTVTESTLSPVHGSQVPRPTGCPPRLRECIDPARFSSYLKLMRVTARLITIGERRPAPRPVTAADLRTAEFRWIVQEQMSLWEHLKDGKFASLAAFVDSDGTIRVGGRVTTESLATYDSKPPVLLPYDSPVARLYAKYVHELNHTGVSATVCKMRKKYWVIQAARLAKTVRHHCMECRRRSKDLGEQIMAPLPECRLTPSPPFLHTAIDLFGPLKTRISRKVRAKSFGIIFTCLMTRAVYVDVAVGASTMDFMMTLRRFATIHGQPAHFYSDNGSQLKAADRELQQIVQSWDANELQEYGANKGTEWTFSAPDSPWRNGCAEALIKSVKRSLRHAIGEQALPFHELQTVLFEAAALVNERPIGRHPQHPEDGSYLAPNDLLLGRASTRVPAGPFLLTNNPRHRHEFVQQIVGTFWKRWRRDAFPALLPRKKWHHEKRDLQAGDLCLVQDTNPIRGKWTMAIVCKTFPSQDGRVRTVELKYKLPQEVGQPYQPKPYKTERRAVQRLVVISPVEEREPQCET